MKDFVRSQTLARLKKLKAALPDAASRPEDPETIHDVRVAIRRLTQCLRLFQGWFDPAAARKIRKHLRKLMDRCGAVRNYDVAVAVLRAAGWRDGNLGADLQRRRRKAQKDLVRRLRARRALEITRRWRADLRVQPSGGGPWHSGDTAAANARRVLPEMMDELFRAGQLAAQPASSLRRMHQFRLMVKRFRYTLELFASFYGTDSGQLKDSLRGLQTRLGAVNDCVTTIELVKADRRAAAAVRRLARNRAAEFRTYWKENFGSAVKNQWKTVIGKPAPS